MAGNKTDITTHFKADISQFSESITSLKRYISTVNSEFRVATKGSSDWAKSQDGLKAKITQLNRSLQAQEQIVAELEKEYDKVASEQGENSQAAQKLTIEINKYRAAISKTKNDINKFNKNLDELGDTAEDSEDDLENLNDATKNLNDGFTIAKGAIAGFVANGLTALVGAAKNAVSSVLGLAEATREYRQTLATLDSASKDAGVSADYVRDKFTDMMGVFNDEDSVTEGLNNLLTAGFDEKSLDDITGSLEGAALKWKDTLKFEGMADSLQEWIGSGGESLSGQFAELLERMGYNLDEVKDKTAGMTAEQRRTYATNLLAAEGLNTVSEEYRKNNKDMVDAQTANVAYQNSVAEMGAKIEPITTKIREGFTKILEKLLELTENVDFEAIGTAIEGAFQYFIDTILPAIIDGFQWIIDHKDILLAGIVAIGSAFVAWKVVGIITSVVKAIKNMSAAMKVLNAVMKANAIGIVITAITALVAAFIYLWNNCEGFRKFWQNLWKSIKDAAKAVADWIGKAFQTAWNAIKNAWSGTKKFFSDIWKSITNTFKSVGEWFSNIFQNAWQGIKNAFSGVKNFFGGIWDSIVSTFKTVGTKVAQAIGGAFKSAINAVISTVEGAINLIPNAINGAIGLINKLPGVEIGRMPTISLPRLAKGGIVDRATIAQIGEAGKEAIVPLERNTQGLREMAGMVAEELKLAGLGGNNITYNNTFTNMPTTRYAMRKAMADSKGMYQLYKAVQGGV